MICLISCLSVLDLKNHTHIYPVYEKVMQQAMEIKWAYSDNEWALDDILKVRQMIALVKHPRLNPIDDDLNGGYIMK